MVWPWGSGLFIDLIGGEVGRGEVIDIFQKVTCLSLRGVAGEHAAIYVY